MFGRTKKKSLLTVGNGRGGRYGSPTLAYRRRRFQRTLTVFAFLALVAAITDLPTLRVQSGRYDIDADARCGQLAREGGEQADGRQSRMHPAGDQGPRGGVGQGE